MLFCCVVYDINFWISLVKYLVKFAFWGLLKNVSFVCLLLFLCDGWKRSWSYFKVRRTYLPALWCFLAYGNDGFENLLIVLCSLFFSLNNYSVYTKSCCLWEGIQVSWASWGSLGKMPGQNIKWLTQQNVTLMKETEPDLVWCIWLLEWILSLVTDQEVGDALEPPMCH